YYVVNMAIRHKHLKLDQRKIDKARRTLGTKTDGNARPCPRHGPRRGPYRPHSAARESDGRVRGRVPASMTKLLLDTNLYVGWLNHGLHEALIVGPGFRALPELCRSNGAASGSRNASGPPAARPAHPRPCRVGE